MVVHDLAQARAALAEAAGRGRAIQLRSAPDAAAYAGVGYLQALGAAAGHELLIDCGDDPGLVMAALRSRLPQAGLHRAPRTAAGSATWRQQAGAELRHEPAPAGP